MNQALADDVVRRLFEVGEPTTRSSMVVRDEEIAFLLLKLADMNAVAPCTFKDCEACDMFNTIWWGWCNDLNRFVRIRLQRIMAGADIPLPPSPVDVTPIHVVPTAR
jgi:hypothetical protein